MAATAGPCRGVPDVGPSSIGAYILVPSHLEVPHGDNAGKRGGRREDNWSIACTPPLASVAAWPGSATNLLVGILIEVKDQRWNGVHE